MKKLWLACGMSLWAGATSAGEENLYDFQWLDPDKAVYVLQNKLHPKEHTFYMDAGYVTNMTSAFQDTKGIMVNGGYHFHEEWAVEALYLGYTNNKNENYQNVEDLNGSVPFVRKPTRTLGAGLLWSPFYGKINTFNKIVYFDWSFGAGIAQVKTQSNLKSLNNSTVSDHYSSESYTGGYLRSTVKFHVNQNWHVGVGWIGTYYKAPGPQNPKQDKLRSNNDMVFSIGWSY